MPSSEDTIALPPTQPPYRSNPSKWTALKRQNRRDDRYAFVEWAQSQNRYAPGVGGAVGL